jgi:hypothetical protein
VQIHFLVGQAVKPVKAKGRAGCPPHKKLFLQKWDAPVLIEAGLGENLWQSPIIPQSKPAPTDRLYFFFETFISMENV